MMTKVTIPPSKAIFREGSFDNDILLTPIRDWLKENTTDYWHWDSRFDRSTLKMVLDFHFSNPGDAILFKLTWH